MKIQNKVNAPLKHINEVNKRSSIKKVIRQKKYKL